jgi:hypothetical protein
MDQPTADEARRRLDPLVGAWDLEAAPPDGEPWPGGGRCTFEWHPTGACLVQHTTIALSEAPDSCSFIGCDAANGTYVQLYSDERGVARVYNMSINEREWKLWRAGEPFAQRFSATFGEDGNTIVGRWEMSEDGIHYATDFDLIYRRSPG